MEKKPNFLFFQNDKYPTQGQNKTKRGYQAFYSRHNAFIEMKMTLHLMTNTI